MKEKNNKKKKKRYNNTDVNTREEYPSAELLLTASFEDYRRIIDAYDKIYEKVNVALAFSGIVLIVILSDFDYTVIKQLHACQSDYELFSLLCLFICSAGASILILWAVIELLMLMKSKSLTFFDSISARNDELYRQQNEVAALWLFSKYTEAIQNIKETVALKQKKYDKSITRIVISIILYAVVLIVKKGA